MCNNENENALRFVSLLGDKREPKKPKLRMFVVNQRQARKALVGAPNLIYPLNNLNISFGI